MCNSFTQFHQLGLILQNQRTEDTQPKYTDHQVNDENVKIITTMQYYQKLTINCTSKVL